MPTQNDREAGLEQHRWKKIRIGRLGSVSCYEIQEEAKIWKQAALKNSGRQITKSWDTRKTESFHFEEVFDKIWTRSSSRHIHNLESAKYRIWPPNEWNGHHKQPSPCRSRKRSSSSGSRILKLDPVGPARESFQDKSKSWWAREPKRREWPKI